MSVICIFLAVFLVTAIFGMADMEIRSQKAQAQINYGKWHAGLRDISDEEMALISLRGLWEPSGEVREISSPSFRESLSFVPSSK